MECVGIGNTDTSKSKVAETVTRDLHLGLSSKIPYSVPFLIISLFATFNLRQIGDLEVSLLLKFL